VTLRFGLIRSLFQSYVFFVSGTQGSASQPWLRSGLRFAPQPRNRLQFRKASPLAIKTTLQFNVVYPVALPHKVIKIASVIADIRRLLAERPFVPFSIYCTDGGVLRIPTVDHAIISPTGRRVIVFFDDDTAVPRLSMQQREQLGEK
jgi:hypothetical protein